MYPAIVVGVSGPRLQIGTVITTDYVHFSKALDWSVADSRNIRDFSRFCRILYALKRCADKLKEEYSSQNAPKLESALELPCIQPRSNKFSLNYQYRMYHGERLPSERELRFFCPDKDLFGANMITRSEFDQTKTREVVVKFTYRYNEDAHRLLAAEGLAPELYWCEVVPGCRGLKMVVMDKVVGKALKGFCEATLPESFFEELLKALVVLHEKNLVFGDFRAQNIMVVGEGENLRPVLLDFDWAAEHGKGLYPSDINMVGMGYLWSKGVGPFALMRKEHDMSAFDKLKDKYQRMI